MARHAHNPPLTDTMDLGSMNGITFGDRCIQIGEFRIGVIDGPGDATSNHMSIGHKSGKTCQIFRQDGTLHPGGGKCTDWNPWSKELGDMSGIAFGDQCIQLGDFRIGVIDAKHMSIGHKSGKTCQIFRQDGTLHPGGGKCTDYNPWSKKLGGMAGITFGNHCIQMGNFRLGAVCGHTKAVNPNHLCIGHRFGETSQIYRNDGTLHPNCDGRNGEWNPWGPPL